MSSEPEFMKRFHQMGLNQAAAQENPSEPGQAAAARPSGGHEQPVSPTRFQRFENKGKPDPNANAPPWLENLKKNRKPWVADAMSNAPFDYGRKKDTIQIIDDPAEDAAALFHAGGGGDNPSPAVVDNEEEEEQSSTLTPEEEETSSRFRRMIQMGMPEGAVTHKMQAEGVPQRVQEAVLSPATSERSIPLAARLSAPQPESTDDDDYIEEEIIEEEVTTTVDAPSVAVEDQSLAESAVMKTKESSENAPAQSSPSGSPKMSDEEFGGGWVVNRDEVSEDGDVPYVYVDENGNEVSVPPEDTTAADEETTSHLQPSEDPTVQSPATLNQVMKPPAQLPQAPPLTEPEHYVERAYDPIYDVENQKSVLNRGTNVYRSKMSKLVPIAFCLGAIAAGLLIFFLVIEPEPEGGENTSRPTSAPTSKIVIPAEPTNSGVIDVAITTPFDPITTDCDFEDAVQPHVITQCACTGSVSFIAPDVKKRYELLALNFMPTLIPDFAGPMSSCDPQNQALLWLSTGSNNAGESQEYVRRERYALAYFFMDQGGIAWAENTNWISDADVCEWSGITCDAKGAVIAIDMPNNRVIGELSPFVMFLDHLETFNATGNRMEGTLPPEMLSSSSLRLLDLSSNFLFGEIPPFPEASPLEIIDFSDNNLSKSIPSTFGNVQSLTMLDLSSNAFSGGIPSELFSLPLQELYLQENALSGSIPDGIFGFSALSILNLSSTQFTGEIPSSLGGITTLTKLVIQKVPTLGGRLPASFGTGLTNLVELVVTDTAIEGNIPTQFGQMMALESMVLSRNSLGGELPAELGLLTNLKILNLEDNLMTGAIPEEIGNAVAMTTMMLSGNSLIGTMPDSIGKMTNLVSLNLDGTFLEGRAPEEVCNLRELSLVDFTVDCPEQLSETVTTGIICSIPSCCTACA